MIKRLLCMHVCLALGVSAAAIAQTEGENYSREEMCAEVALQNTERDYAEAYEACLSQPGNIVPRAIPQPEAVENQNRAPEAYQGDAAQQQEDYQEYNDQQDSYQEATN